MVKQNNGTLQTGQAQQKCIHPHKHKVNQILQEERDLHGNIQQLGSAIPIVKAEQITKAWLITSRKFISKQLGLCFKCLILHGHDHLKKKTHGLMAVCAQKDNKCRIKILY